MPNAPRLPRRLLFGALASLALPVAAACGPSLTSLARDTFFVGYGCPKKEITVTGGGDNPYDANGCGKHALYRCHSQNGGMGCEELLPAGAGVASASSAPPPSPSPPAAAPSDAPAAHP
jgi:hypothetical protein